jgi:hypothetical protein
MYVEIWFMNRAVEKKWGKERFKIEIRIILHSELFGPTVVEICF